MLLLNGISTWLKFKLILYQLGEWPEVCERGSRQSPIGVCKRKAKSASIPPLEFYHYNQKFKAFVENKGYTVEIKIDDRQSCEVPTLKGGNLEGEYILDSIHFHWEAEHTIDGKRYPLECHYLHYNKKCGDLESAAKHPNGLVMLAVMFEIATCFNPRLECIINTTEAVSKHVNKPKELRGGIVVDQILPKNRMKFFTYDGSNTFPNCEETVKWIIFEELLPIGRDQLRRITDIDSETGERLKRNARPIQDLNDREVLYSSDTFNIHNVKEYVKEQLDKLWG